MADQTQVEFETSLGNFKIELAADKTPVTVENFLSYVDAGYYEGVIFHRIIADFMIQGGGYVSIGQEKREGLLPPIKNEAAQGLNNARGTISMARTNDPHSATSQFFINVVDNQMLDPNHASAGYCAFGQVVEGMDIVDKIRNVKTQPNPMMPGENSMPADPPVINAVRRVDA